MPVRPEVREAQRTIAALDAAHRHAANRLEDALARRAEVVAEQGQLVAMARADLDRAVAAMANQVSAELAAQLLGLELADVRRLAKLYPFVATDSPSRSDQREKVSQ